MIRKKVKLAFRLARKRTADHLEWAREAPMSNTELKGLLINAYLLGAKDVIVQLKTARMLHGELKGYLKSVDNLKYGKSSKLP